MSDTIWVGKNDEGKLFIYDPGIQIKDCPHLFLWEPESSEIVKYSIDDIKKILKPIKNPSTEEYVTSYKQWYESKGQTWLTMEKFYYAERNNKDKIRQIDNLSRKRHKKRLEDIRQEYRGVRPSKRRISQRSTHCYSCKHPLDNAVNIECNACDWIICTCGACGCGYYR